ncbi:MAG: ABC transporter permease, partial [Erysipelotrichaceae bacterium]|nr:ABC transporter permease [Erysipelotrichaceae bacterium]
IMYYKQISEGFEDQGRFGIMKKVGMTSKEIQSTVNSQMLTVFLAPAVFAGLNLVFASPTLWTFLRYALVSNTGYLIAITGGIFAIYVLTYIVIYKLTANAYTKIINV